MCGILVYKDLNKNKINVKDKFSKALKSIQHRGKDSSVVKEEDNILFGHNRLHITGNKEDIQPFENKRYILVVNGEFYNYQKEKEKLNYKFKTNSDSELILGLLNKYSLESKLFWKKLNGEFSFVVYDKKKKKIHFVRDRIGIKPLYYIINKEEILATSEVKSIKHLSRVDFDKEVLFKKICMQYHSEDETLWEGINQVPPGEFVSYDFNTNEKTSKKYWDIYDKKIKKTIKDKDVFDIIEDAVKIRVKDKNVAVCLSGGIDSTIINYFVKKHSKSYKTFSIDFTDDKEYSEKGSIDLINKYFDNDSKIINVSNFDLLKGFEESIYFSEDVSINLHHPAKMKLYKEIKKEYDIVISGEGSDEFFLGYSHFLEDMKKKGNKLLKNMHGISGEILFDKELKELNIESVFIKSKLSQGLLTKKLTFLKNKPDFLKKFVLKKSFKEKVYKSSYLWTKMCLNNYILSGLCDKLEMANTLEGRIPFLDFRVIDIATNLSVSRKIKGNTEKYVLKKIFKGKIPIEIIEKTKHPFISSPVDLTNSEIKKFFIKKVKNFKLDFVNKEELIEVIKNGDNSFSHSILMIYSLDIIKKRINSV